MQLDHLKRREFMSLLGGALAAWPLVGALAHAQDAGVPRVGVILQGGLWYAVIDGLRQGLKQLGLVEGKHFVLEIRDTQGDLKRVEDAARSLERQNVSLIYSVATSVTLATKRATQGVPIVFFAGTNPVPLGLVESPASAERRDQALAACD
jgi:putative ABC transport system substrate-binding protein